VHVLYQYQWAYGNIPWGEEKMAEMSVPYNYFYSVRKRFFLIGNKWADKPSELSSCNRLSLWNDTKAIIIQHHLRQFKMVRCRICVSWIERILCQLPGKFLQLSFFPLTDIVVWFQTFTRFVEVGRVVLINYGENKGKICTVIDVVDAKRVSLQNMWKVIICPFKNDQILSQIIIAYDVQSLSISAHEWSSSY
jgi:hypothetical protein